MSKLETLVEELGKLTVVEAGELAKKLEKTWGIDLAAIQGSAPAPVQEKEDSLFKVTLTGFDAGKKIGVIKAVRAFKDMGLLEAKNFVEGVPSVIAEDQQKEEADKIKKDIETAGGKIEINSFSFASFSRFLLIVKFAATPPAITKVFLLFCFTFKNSFIATLVFS